MSDTPKLEATVKKAVDEKPEEVQVTPPPPKRKPGRPIGYKAKPKATKAPSVKAANIRAAHVVVAMATGCPELAIDDSEAALLETAINDFIAAYPELAEISPKVAATFTLLTTAVIVYAPRLLKISARASKRAKPKLVNNDATAAH